MAVYSLSLKATAPAVCRDGALTIGNFDGVHLGHQALLAETQRQAQKINGPAVAVTFEPHPLQLLRPEAFQPVLTTVSHRAELLQRHGANHVVILHTSQALLQLTPAEFIDRLIGKGLEARVVVEGFNFFFGQGRTGNLDTLRRLCRDHGMEVVVMPPIERDGRPVSSSRVRDALVAGKVTEAAELLGRPFRLDGVVGKGQKRGQTLGFPTANLEKVETIVPGHGVYAVRAWVGNASWPAAANVGPNPTFGEQERKIEVHVIGFQGDLYGQMLAVDFLAKIRDVRTFAGPQELLAQIGSDVAEAQRLAATETAVAVSASSSKC